MFDSSFGKYVTAFCGVFSPSDFASRFCCLPVPRFASSLVLYQTHPPLQQNAERQRRMRGSLHPTKMVCFKGLSSACFIVDNLTCFWTARLPTESSTPRITPPCRCPLLTSMRMACTETPRLLSPSAVLFDEWYLLLFRSRNLFYIYNCFF